MVPQLENISKTVPGKTYAQALAMGKQCTHSSYMSPTKSQATRTKNQKQKQIQSGKLQSVVQNTSLKEHTPTVQRLSIGGSVTRGSSTEALDQVLLKNRLVNKVIEVIEK